MDNRAWLAAAGAVFVKDLRIELRTRHALGTVALFSVSTLIAVSAALSVSSVRSDVKAAVLWIVLLFAALSGLARVWVREMEAGTAALLKIAAPASALYAGKWLFNLALTLAVEAVSVPLFLVMLPPQTVNPGPLLGVLILGGVGLSSASTFVAALIAQASTGKSALFFVAAFPALLPLLITATQATVGCFDAVPVHLARTLNDLRVLGAYAVVMTAASFTLFDLTWND